MYDENNLLFLPKGLLLHNISMACWHDLRKWYKIFFSFVPHIPFTKISIIHAFKLDPMTNQQKESHWTNMNIYFNSSYLYPMKHLNSCHCFKKKFWNLYMNNKIFYLHVTLAIFVLLSPLHDCQKWPCIFYTRKLPEVIKTCSIHHTTRTDINELRW